MSSVIQALQKLNGYFPEMATFRARETSSVADNATWPSPSISVANMFNDTAIRENADHQQFSLPVQCIAKACFGRTGSGSWQPCPKLNIATDTTSPLGSES